jgi:hypothetical protein
MKKTSSRKSHSTVPVRINGMALSIHCELPALFSPWQVNLKIPINSGLRQAGIVCPQKMTLVIKSAIEI